MRQVINLQLQLSEVEISQIEIDLRSRDETPKLLHGLQYIYSMPDTRREVFQILEGMVPQQIDPHNGRPGLDLWKVLVLGALRLNSNWNYDKLQDIANNHKTLRQMLGHGILNQNDTYALQTLKDNVSLLTPEILDQINQVVVKAGHSLVGNQEQELKGKCDSFVVKTDVHYPTDINLLFDAVRQVITLIARSCSEVGLQSWRQSHHNIRKIKKLFRKAQQLKRSTSKDEAKKAKRVKLIIAAHQGYIDVVQSFLERSLSTIDILRGYRQIGEDQIAEISQAMAHAHRQIDQIRRRVIQGESIPHIEKVFSIFEEHTEWISKGKAGVPQELGLRVCILEDQHRFILHHQVMEQQTDDVVTVSMVSETQERYSTLTGCSFDKGFYSPLNQKELEKLLDQVVLPKKGGLSVSEKEIESSDWFMGSRRQHSAVESAIHALENHGLDRCPDHGLIGFKRYVALAVVARNLQTLGTIVQKKELRRQKRRQKFVQGREQEPYRSVA
jgi:hypothetical protein